MPARTVNLTEYHDNFVHNLIASGRFKDASEALQAALRLLEQQSREDEEKLQRLRQMATEGFDMSVRCGENEFEDEESIEEFIAQLGQRLE